MSCFKFAAMGPILALGMGCGSGDNGVTIGNGGSGGASTTAATGSSGAGPTGGAGGAAAGAGGSGGGAAGTSAGSGGTGGSSALDAAADRTGATSDAGDASGAFDASIRDASDARLDAPSGDGAPAYNPCPPRGTPCPIMPLGDSITQGVPDPAAGGYRAALFHLARMNMQTITFVGSGMDGPATVDGVAFPRAHEGHSGFNIDTTQGRMGISQFFPNAILTFRPKIVLLMIGTNDVDTAEDMIPTRLGNLMDTILNADTTALLVVAQIVPQQRATPDTLNMQVQAFNAAIPNLVKTRADAGKHVVMVDMYDAFASTPNYSQVLLADRLHPTPAGFAVMANTWYAAIGSLLR